MRHADEAHVSYLLWCLLLPVYIPGNNAPMLADSDNPSYSTVVMRELREHNNCTTMWGEGRVQRSHYYTDQRRNNMCAIQIHTNASSIGPTIKCAVLAELCTSAPLFNGFMNACQVVFPLSTHAQLLTCTGRVFIRSTYCLCLHMHSYWRVQVECSYVVRTASVYTCTAIDVYRWSAHT